MNQLSLPLDLMITQERTLNSLKSIVFNIDRALNQYFKINFNHFFIVTTK